VRPPALLIVFTVNKKKKTKKKKQTKKKKKKIRRVQSQWPPSGRQKIAPWTRSSHNRKRTAQHIDLIYRGHIFFAGTNAPRLHALSRSHGDGSAGTPLPQPAGRAARWVRLRRHHA